MSTVVPSGVDPRHDLVHQPGDYPAWRESYYFSFYDPEQGIGGFSSIGKRPAKGHSGFIACIWGEDRPTLVATALDQFDRYDDEHHVAGLEYQCIKPYEEWAIRFDGELNDGGEDVQCAFEAVAPIEKSGLPRRRVEMDLRFVPKHAPYFYEAAAKDDRWRELFDGHVDMIGQTTGTIRIDGDSINVNAIGGNDHSWGKRNWFHPDQWRWMDIAIQDAPSVTMWRSLVGGEWFGDGALYQDGRAYPLDAYSEQVDVQPRSEKPQPVGFSATARAGDLETEIRAEVTRIVPVIFTREEDDRTIVSWNDRALIKATAGDFGTGWGNVEFSQRVERE